MSIKMTGLGRGLDALIRETADTGEQSLTPQMVRVADLMPNPNQPRKHFEETALAELAASISSQGVLQPLLVRPLGASLGGKYEIVAGERRWRACQIANVAEVPVVIRSLTEQETLMAALVENLQREDLNPIEEALGIDTLREEFGLNQDELATRLGKSRSAIANSLRLLSLPAEIQADVAEGLISAGHARALLAVSDVDAQLALRQRIIEAGLSVRETEGMVSLWKNTGSFDDFSSVAAKRTIPAANRKQPASERLLLAQKTLAARLPVKVKINGTEQKGRISMAFSSSEELDALLSVFEKL